MALPALLERPIDRADGGAPVTPLPQGADGRPPGGPLPECLLRVGLIGFGRTGRDVARFLLADPSTSLQWVVRRSEAHENDRASEVLGVDSEQPGRLHSTTRVSAAELLSRSPVDVIIDFSSESGIDYYGEQAAARAVAVVSAVSRYSEGKQRTLEQLGSETRVLWSPNITLGINVMLLAAQTLKAIAPDADVRIVEEHFRDKAEVSGTALRLARALDVPEDDVHVIRAGGIVGVHEVLFGFPSQTVRLRHEAISREAFGDGALFAARHLVDRDPGLYRMEDLLRPYVTGRRTAVAPSQARRGGVRGRVASGLRAVARRLE